MSLTPGLYKATVRGVPGTVVLIDCAGYGLTPERINGIKSFAPDEITDARPLVVLDLEDPAEAVRHLRSCVAHWDEIELIADAIEAQTKPPRIPEPGQWGVVEATYNGVTGRVNWVHDEYGWASHSGMTLAWDRLIDPTLVRAGVDS